jgi:hypothetical protein
MSRRDRDPRKRLSRPRVPGESVDPVSVGDAAALVGAELGLAEPLVFSRIVEAWPDLVGEAVAAHSRVRTVRNGIIEIAVDSPAWATEFRYLERDLVARASRLVGKGVVVGIRAVVERRTGSPDEPDGDPREPPRG